MIWGYHCFRKHPYTLMIMYILQDYAISILYNHIYVIWKSSSGIFLPIMTPAVHVIDAHLTWTGWNTPFSMVKFVADKRSETVQRFPGAFRCHGRKAVGRMAECIKSNSSGGDPGGINPWVEGPWIWVTCQLDDKWPHPKQDASGKLEGFLVGKFPPALKWHVILVVTGGWRVDATKQEVIGQKSR